MSQPTHFSSLLVTAQPDALASVATAINAMHSAEIAENDTTSKLIVLMETQTESDIVDGLGQIQLIPGVVSAALVYHQTEDNPDAAAPTPKNTDATGKLGDVQ